MRALIVTPSYPIPGAREGGIFIHRQVLNLVRCGIDCRVLVFQPAPPPFPAWLRQRTWWRYHAQRLLWRGEVDGIRVDSVPYERRWTPGEDVVPAIGDALCAWMAAHRLSFAPDVVYAQFLWPAGSAALALRQRFGTPLAAIARGGEMEQWHPHNPHCRAHVQRVLCAADRPLANCRALRDIAMRLAPRPAVPVEVVYNGCDTSVFRPAEDRNAVRRALGVGPDERLALFCGSIEEVKGIEELSEAWTAFCATRPGWRLVVVGRSVDRRLDRRLRGAARGRVRFAGQAPPRRVVQWLQSADVYLQPSRLEGLANASMEAMAAALPVISTDVGGQAEVIRDGQNGWLVPPRNPNALRAALETVAAHREEAQRRGAEARRTIVTQFDAARQAERLAGILRECARPDEVHRRHAR